MDGLIVINLLYESQDMLLEKMSYIFVVIQQICVPGSALLSEDILTSQNPFDKVTDFRLLKLSIQF